MAKFTIALAPGDGIGPEIMTATLALFKAAGVTDHLDFIPVEMGKRSLTRGSRAA
jgi:isocitrate dehydrogenase